MYCPSCGLENEPQAKFCAKCGTVVTNDQQMNAPQNVQSSYAQQPPGFVAGAFPKEHLISGEMLYWEGKPALIAYILLPLIVTILGVLFLIILPGFGIFLIVLGIIGIVVWYLRWTRAAFALTNRRVLAKYGVFSTKFADCPHDKIQTTSVMKPFIQTLLGYGSILFATAGFSGGINNTLGGGAKWMSTGGGIIWDGIPHPADVKRYAEEVIEKSRQDSKMKEYQMMSNVLSNGKMAEAQMMAGAMRQNQPAVSQAPIEERLAKAKQLRETNTISQEEYEQMRKKILSES